jgi:hypothetical protein
MWYPEISLRHKILCSGPHDSSYPLPHPIPVRHGDLMSHEELLALLGKARTVLDRDLFDDSEAIRDDVAQIGMAIDDALPSEGRVEVKKAELERVSQRSAA